MDFILAAFKYHSSTFPPTCRYELFVDDLPVWGFVGPPPEEGKESQGHIWTHKSFDIDYNDNRVCVSFLPYFKIPTPTASSFSQLANRICHDVFCASSWEMEHAEISIDSVAVLPKDDKPSRRRASEPLLLTGLFII